MKGRTIAVALCKEGLDSVVRRWGLGQKCYIPSARTQFRVGLFLFSGCRAENLHRPAAGGVSALFAVPNLSFQCFANPLVALHDRNEQVRVSLDVPNHPISEKGR